MRTEWVINSKPKKTGHIYRERIRLVYSTPPYIGQVLSPENKAGKAQEYRAHRSTHPQRAGRAGAGRTRTPQTQHHAATPQAGQARHRAHHRTGAQHHTEAQHTEERTREYTRVHRGVL